MSNKDLNEAVTEFATALHEAGFTNDDIADTLTVMAGPVDVCYNCYDAGGHVHDLGGRGEADDLRCCDCYTDLVGELCDHIADPDPVAVAKALAWVNDAADRYSLDDERARRVIVIGLVALANATQSERLDYIGQAETFEFLDRR